MKKVTKTFFVLALILILALPAFATTGNDKVDWLIEKKIVIGDGSGSYKLQENISRSEAAKMLVESINKRAEADALKGAKPIFKDVDQKAWYNGYLNYGIQQGIINGYEDNTFRANDPVSYEEMLKMLVVAHKGLTGKEESTGYWSTIYINKAREMGMLEGISVVDYKAKASRERVFEMIYNSLEGGSQVYTNPLAKEEYYAVVNGVDGLANIEAKLNLIVIEAGTGSAQDVGTMINVSSEVGNLGKDILGKPVKIKLNDRGLLESIVEAKEVTIFDGPAELREGKVYSSGFNFNVPRDHQAKSMLVHNDKLEAYGEFIRKNGSNTGTRGSFISEYARVFVRNNFALFVESYVFEDIAPVQSGPIFGAGQVYFYDDSRNGSAEAISLDKVIGFKAGQKVSMELKDIKQHDVIHVYNGKSALVRTDGLASGKVEELFTKNNANYARINGSDHQLRIARDKKPILSSLAKMETMDAEKLRNYHDLVGKSVDYILDLDQNIQWISTDALAGSGNVGLYRSEGPRYLDIAGFKGDLTPGARMEYLVNGKRGDSRDFREGDLVHVTMQGQEVQILNRLYTAGEMDKNAAALSRDRNNNPVISNTEFELVGGGWQNVYDYNGSTQVFVVQGDTRDGLTKMEKADMDFVRKNSGTNTRAFVLTTDQFNRLVGTSSASDNNRRLAHTVVFFSFGVYDSPIASNSYRVEKDFTGGRGADKGMTLRAPDSRNGRWYEFYDEDYGRKLDSIPAGTDIQVEFRGDRIYEVVKVFDHKGREATYRVGAISHPDGGDGLIVLYDNNQDSKVFALNYRNYSDRMRTVEKGDIVSVDYTGDELKELIRVYPRGTTVTGKF